MPLRTDGGGEVLDADDEEFGEDRLFEVARSRSGQSNEEPVVRMLEAVRAHAATAPPHGDVRPVVARVL